MGIHAAADNASEIDAGLVGFHGFGIEGGAKGGIVGESDAEVFKQIEIWVVAGESKDKVVLYGY